MVLHSNMCCHQFMHASGGISCLCKANLQICTRSKHYITASLVLWWLQSRSANWHSRQPEIVHQLMRQPPKALPMGSGLCTIWRQACSPPFPTVPSGIARDQISPIALTIVVLRTRRKHGLSLGYFVSVNSCTIARMA